MDALNTTSNLLKNFAAKVFQFDTYGIKGIQEIIVIAILFVGLTTILSVLHSWGFDFVGETLEAPEDPVSESLGGPDEMVSASEDMVSEFVGYVGEALGDVADTILGKPKKNPVVLTKQQKRSGLRWAARNWHVTLIITLAIVAIAGGVSASAAAPASAFLSSSYTPSYKASSTYTPSYKASSTYTPSYKASSSYVPAYRPYAAYKPPVAPSTQAPRFKPYRP